MTINRTSTLRMNLLYLCRKNLMSSLKALFSFTLVLFLLMTSRVNAAEDARPNIILILVDDLGFSDIGCYGGEIETPHLDALAAGGVRFSQFYNMARCCPTRATLMTGLHPHQTGIGWMTDPPNNPRSQFQASRLSGLFES